MEQEEAELLIPFSEALPRSLSSLFLVHRSPRRSHGVVLGTAALCEPSATWSALEMPQKPARIYLGSPGITSRALAVIPPWMEALQPLVPMISWEGAGCSVRAQFVYCEAAFSPQLLVPPVEQDCTALPKHWN